MDGEGTGSGDLFVRQRARAAAVVSACARRRPRQVSLGVFRHYDRPEDRSSQLPPHRERDDAAAVSHRVRFGRHEGARRCARSGHADASRDQTRQRGATARPCPCRPSYLRRTARRTSHVTSRTSQVARTHVARDAANSQNPTPNSQKILPSPNFQFPSWELEIGSWRYVWELGIVELGVDYLKYQRPESVNPNPPASTPSYGVFDQS